VFGVFIEKCSSGEETVENENPLAVIYRQSAHFIKVKEQLSQISDGIDPEVTKADRVGYATSFYYQVRRSNWLTLPILTKVYNQE